MNISDCADVYEDVCDEDEFKPQLSPRYSDASSGGAASPINADRTSEKILDTYLQPDDIYTDTAIKPDNNETTSSLFGRMIGMELEKLDPFRQHIARRQIEDIIFQNKFGQLHIPKKLRFD